MVILLTVFMISEWDSLKPDDSETTKTKIRPPTDLWSCLSGRCGQFAPPAKNVKTLGEVVIDLIIPSTPGKKTQKENMKV